MLQVLTLDLFLDDTDDDDRTCTLRIHIVHVVPSFARDSCCGRPSLYFSYELLYIQARRWPAFFRGENQSAWYAVRAHATIVHVLIYLVDVKSMYDYLVPGVRSNIYLRLANAST